MSEETSIVHVEHGGQLEVRNERTVSEIVDRVNLVHKVLEKVMIDGTHYGIVPGCGSKKVLLKPGAEALAVTFKLCPYFDVKKTILEDGHREYEVVCDVFTTTGLKLGQGVGSASSLESKYRYRKHYCADGKLTDGYGKKYNKVENEDIADTFNTVLKIAKKRAYIDGVLTVTGASDLFTQDIIEEEETVVKTVVVKEETKKTEATTQSKPADPQPEKPKSKPQDTPKDMSNMPEGVLTVTGKIIMQGVKGKAYWVKIGQEIYSAYADDVKNTEKLARAKDEGAEVTVWYKEYGKFKNIVDVDIQGAGQAPQAETEKEALPF